MTFTEAEPRPLRLPLPEAARMLRLTPDYLRRLVNDGVFSVIRPNGVGVGKRMYLLPAEVEAFATGGIGAVAEMRKNNTPAAR
jgi:hypothetical protein